MKMLLPEADLNSFELGLIKRLSLIIEARRRRLAKEMPKFIQVKKNSLCMEIHVEDADEIEEKWVQAAELFSCSKNWINEN